MKKDIIKIRLKNGTILNYKVEIPEIEREYCTGLAGRKSLKSNTGMLYLYNNSYSFESYPGEAIMFTPQTEIPVDFIFADDVGNIIKIHHNAEPLSEEYIKCFCTGYVLEINAGECKKNNINVGDVIFFSEKDFNNAFLPMYKDNAEYFKMHNEIFCKDKTADLYTYTYKVHRWQKVDDSVIERMNERLDNLAKFIEKEPLNAEEANKIAIETDKNLLNDLNQTRKRYYWARKTLFIEFNYEVNELKYYDYQNGWTQVFWNNFYFDFIDMKWNTLLVSQKEINDKIIQIESQYTKAELKKECEYNKIAINKIIEKKYPVGTILYKKTNTQGWKIAKIAGNKKECLKICNDYKKTKKWFDFKYYTETVWGNEQNYDTFSCFEDAEYIHEHTSLVGIPSIRKYFLDTEEIPYPSKNAKYTENFDIEVEFNPNDEELCDLNYYEEPTTEVNISFISDASKKAVCMMIVEDNLKAIRKFLRKIKTSAFAVYSNCTYSPIKLLAWRKNDNIRLMFQYYNDNIKTPLDIEIPAKLFYKKMNSMINDLSIYAKYTKRIWLEYNDNKEGHE